MNSIFLQKAKKAVVALALLLPNTLQAQDVIPIADVRQVNAEGVPLMLDQQVTVEGIMIGLDGRADSDGFNFTIQGETAGVNIYQTSTVVADENFQEGDKLRITGTVIHYNGLTEIVDVTAITKLSSDNARPEAEVVSALTEAAESKLIKLENISLSASDWEGSSTNAGNFNVTITLENGENYTMRIDGSTPLAQMTYDQVFGVYTSNVDIVGIGGQYDRSSPYDEGYQIFPYQASDVTIPQSETPVLLSLTPDNGLSNVEPNADFSMGFDETVYANEGSIRLYNADDVLVEEIDINSQTVKGSASAKISFEFSEPLANNEAYYITLDAGALKDADGNLTEAIEAGDWTFTTILSQDQYYCEAKGRSGEALKTALHRIIRNHKVFPYTSGSTDVWDIVRQTDEDPNNSDNIILLYTGRSQAKSTQDDGQSGGDAWNREHVWSKSHGFRNEEDTAYTDVHHLRAADRSVNSARNHKDFDEGGSAHSEATDCNYTSNTWEPRDEVKGDVARMMFYMATRYEGSYDLEVVEEIIFPSTTPKFGRLSTLLKWHNEDPVDDRERNRNEIIYDFQGNRNPFIDHPEFVAKIWGGESSYEDVDITCEQSVVVMSATPDSQINITVQPNPNFGNLTVALPKATAGYQLNIYSLQGELLKQVRTNGGEQKVNLNKLPKGVYLLNITDGKQTVIKRIVRL